MMDGVYFGALSVVFGTVRQFFRHFDDGRSDGWLDEWPERRLPRRFSSRNNVKGYVKRLPEQFRESLTVLWR